MVSFINSTSLEIFKSYPLAELKDISIILPSKRSTLEFKKELSRHAEVPFLAPKLHSIDDFVIGLSLFEIMENLELYILMYEIYQEIDESIAFEKFLSWAPVIISDFESLDLAYFENPSHLFKLMGDFKSLEYWSEDDLMSENSNSYYGFFDKIGQLYYRLQATLRRLGKAYKGLAYRLAVENLDAMDFGVHHFVGLNALSKAEELILKHIDSSKKAKFHWDSDIFITDSNLKAGKKLKEYRRLGTFGKWAKEDNQLLLNDQKVQVFEMPSNTQMIKTARKLVDQDPMQKQVVVVLDEALFVPLITNFSTHNLSINISIGQSIKYSDLMKFIFYLFDGQARGVPYQKKNLLINLFSNQVFQLLYESLFGQKEFLVLKNTLLSLKTLHVKQSNIPIKNRIVDLIFTNNYKNFLKELKFINATLGEIYPDLSQMDKLVFKIYEEQLNLLDSFVNRNEIFNEHVLRKVWYDLVNQIKVPFESNKEASIQIMSMLETRCLDFENVTFLSLNEGNLPAKKTSNSFFNHKIKFEAGIPVYSDQDSIMAYHFWRLLKRAKNINFLYLNSKSGVSATEKSSFLNQFLHILAPINPSIAINRYEIKNEGEKKGKISAEISIKKTQQLLHTIKKILLKKPLSATSLNVFNECTLKFYFKYIEQIQEPEVLSTNLMANDYGTIVHQILEHLDGTFLKSTFKITKFDLEQLKLKVERSVMHIFGLYDKLDFSQGYNALIKEMTKSVLEKYFDYRIEHFIDSYYVLENEFKVEVPLPSPFEMYRIKGTIDKIEEHADHFKIIDFKTGKFEGSIKNDEKIKLQLAVYHYLLKNAETYNKTPKQFRYTIYPLKNISQCDSIDVDDNEFKAIKETLVDFIHVLLDENQEFRQTSDYQVCKSCAFKETCFK